MKIRFLFILLSAFIFTACPSSIDDGDEDSSELPKSIDYFEVSMYNGGGMLPISNRTFISSDSAYWSYDRYNFETIIKWNPSEIEINSLYDDLKNYKFDKIKSDCDGEVFDRGGISISFIIDDQKFNLDNSGNCFIQEKWKSNYSNVVSRISKYRNEKVEERLLMKSIVVTNDLINAGYDIDITVNNGEFNFNPNLDTLEKKAQLYPGYNEFIIKLNYPDSTDNYGSPANFKYEQYFDSISTDSKKVIIDWKDERITLDVEN